MNENVTKQKYFMPEFDETAFREAMETGVPADEFVDTTTEEVEQEETTETAAEETTTTAETENTEETSSETTETTETTEQPKTIEVIKEVEKIVEKWPEFKNDKSKDLFNRLTNAEDPKQAEKEVLEYLREKNRDYTVMSDVDIVKSALRKENPSWTKDDVDLKMRRIYGKNLNKIDTSSIDQDLDPDKYENALKHNEDVENALADLRLDALQKRPALIQAQQELELPTIQQQETAAQPNQPTQADIEAANAKWLKTVEASLPSLSQIKQIIDDKEVVYDLNDTDKKELGDDIKNFNLLNFSKARGWQNEDGTPNILKLAEDVLKLKSFDKISKSYATQIKTETTKDVLKQIKNVDDKKSPPQSNSVSSLEDAYFASKK